MCLSEIERKRYLQLQGFFIQVKALVEELEKKLKAKPPEEKHPKTSEHQEKVNASTC